MYSAYISWTRPHVFVDVCGVGFVTHCTNFLQILSTLDWCYFCLEMCFLHAHTSKSSKSDLWLPIELPIEIFIKSYFIGEWPFNRQFPSHILIFEAVPDGVCKQ